MWGTLRREAEEVNNGPDPEAGGWEGDKKSMVSFVHSAILGVF